MGGIGLDLNSEILHFHERNNVLRQWFRGCRLVVLLEIGWQRALMIPASLLAAVLQRMQKNDDPFSDSTTLPLLSSNADDLPRANTTQCCEETQHRRRLVNYHCHKGIKINRRWRIYT